MVKTSVTRLRFGKKLIYMFAMREYKEGSWQFISFLKSIKDTMALMLDGRLFRKINVPHCSRNDISNNWYRA